MGKVSAEKRENSSYLSRLKKSVNKEATITHPLKNKSLAKYDIRFIYNII
ncbi:hypothetical protein [Xenorhabdus thuongxuanensis]|nr:hypothetical protein [Xenorhabdus thuongxuanensis]